MIPDINGGGVMQIATARNGVPWICTVYFVFTEGKFYWLSFPERRHSRDIADNDHVAVAVALEMGQPVVGVQAEGRTRQVADQNEVATVMESYVAKYNQGGTFT